MFKLYINTASGKNFIKNIETIKEAQSVCLGHNIKLHPEMMKANIGTMFFIEE